MSPEALERKLEFIASHLDELADYKNCSYKAYWKDHLKVDRLLGLIITAAIDAIPHLPI